MGLASNFVLIIILLCAQFSAVMATSNVEKKNTKPAFEFSSLDNLLQRDFFIDLDKNNFRQDITNDEPELFISFDPRELAVSKTYPQIIKFEIFQVDSFEEYSLLAVVNQSYKNIRKLKKTFMKVPLPSLIQSTKIAIKVYDSNGIEAGFFTTNIFIENNSTESLEDFEEDDVVCDGTFGQCQMEFLMKNFNLVGVNSKQPATIITKERTGEYTARIPLVAQGKKKVKTKIRVNAAGISSNRNSIISFENRSETVKAEMGWDEVTDSLKISFPGSDKSFTFSEEGLLNITKTTDTLLGSQDDISSLSLQDGDATQVPIQIEAGELTITPVDGALEYDGSELYFTSGGNRRRLGSSNTSIVSGGNSVSLTGPTSSIMLKSGSNSLTGSTSLDFIAGSLRVNNAIVFQSLNAENYTGAQTLNWATGNQKRITLTGNTTLSFSNPAGFCSLLLEIHQDATGARSITWPASVLWSGGTTPVLSTAANAIDVITCFYNGTNYLCQAGLDFQ
jgi:hypothetical protein